MEWLKKKKDEAKQAAAKLQNKRTAFKGDGNVLGGGGDADDAQAGSEAAARGGKTPALKMPSIGKSAPPTLTPEEQRQRREQQQKALEQRENAWEKRVDKARRARLQQEEENAARLGVDEPAALPPPPPPSSATGAANLPPPVVLSNEEVKAREVRNAHAQMGFNPYAATFSSSSEATTAMNSIGGRPQAQASAQRQTASASPAAFASPGDVAEPVASMSIGQSEGGGAVYVLLRQDPARAITAAETLIKLLANIAKNPQEEKFRKVRLSNAAIQAKLVAVNGAVDILREAGFSDATVEGEAYLTLAEMDAARVQSAIDRTEVALIQLQHDTENA